MRTRRAHTNACVLSGTRGQIEARLFYPGTPPQYDSRVGAWPALCDDITLAWERP